YTWRALAYADEDARPVHAAMLALAEQEASQRALKEQLGGQLERLDAQESNLLELAVDDTIPKEKIRAKLREIGIERERLTAQPPARPRPGLLDHALPNEEEGSRPHGRLPYFIDPGSSSKPGP